MSSTEALPRGKQCDYFEDRYLKVKVSLNQELGVNKLDDQDDKEPILIKLEETEDGRKWYSENVVFLYEDSHISFTLTSTGPCGYGFKIFTMEQNIINRLYAGNEGTEGEVTVQVSRYQNDASSIRVNDFQYFLKDVDNNIYNNILKRSLVSIITWPIFGYERGCYQYRPGIDPVNLYHKIKINQNKIKYFESKDLKKHLKSKDLKRSINFSSKAIETPIPDSNYIVKGTDSQESFDSVITNIVEDNDPTNLKTNGSINMLFFILKKGEHIKDVCQLKNDKQ
ncbi:MAG: hypothetical protein F6K21_13370 [Symploca sp. SIO2D2]|nr:hypothetical protein [Symploca sp. SIO2D2]